MCKNTSVNNFDQQVVHFVYAVYIFKYFRIVDSSSEEREYISNDTIIASK